MSGWNTQSTKGNQAQDWHHLKPEEHERLEHTVNERESSQEVTHERSAKGNQAKRSRTSGQRKGIKPRGHARAVSERESIKRQQILTSETLGKHQLNASMAQEVHPRSLCGLACGPHGTSKHRHTSPHGTGGEGILGRSERAKRLYLLVCGNVPTFELTWLMVILTARWITPCEERSKRGRGERTRREDEPSRRVSQVAKRDEGGSFWCALSLEGDTSNNTADIKMLAHFFLSHLIKHLVSVPAASWIM
jgi:hypothetical protein